MDDRLPRKLAVILHADVVGSTSLVQKNESLAHTRIQNAFQRLALVIEAYNGTTHELRGDALVAEFARGSDAVGAALAFQTENTESNARLEDDLKPRLRIGISLGEVVIADSTVTGAGVVLAQRVEQLAEPGGVCITGAVHEAVPQHLPLDYSDLGKQEVKGFEEPVQVYGAFVKAGEQIPPPEPVVSAAQARGSRGLWFTGAVALVAVVAGAFAWYQFGKPDVEPASIQKMAFPLPEKPSIAVLPFDNLSGDAKQDFLADGLSEEIITTLSKIPKLFVIARNSTFTYKGKAVSVKQVAEEQGVRYVLEGSLQRSGDRIRINAQLIDALEGHHLWAERYDREFKDIFALQDDITRKIMVAMQVNLTEGEVMSALQGRIASAQAFEYFLKGRDHYQRYNKEDNAIGRQLVLKAVELEPDNTAIWVQLAWYDFIDARFGWTSDPHESLEKAVQVADKVYAIDPDDAKVNGLLGSLSLYRGNHDEAIAYARRAVELAPGDAIEIGILAWVLAYSGYPEEAVPLLEKAMRLSPYYPSHFAAMLGLAHMMTGDYKQAIAAHEYLVERKSLLQFAYSRLAGINATLGNEEKAKAYAGELLRIYPNFNIESWSKLLLYRNPEDRERELDALRLVGIAEKPPLPLPDKPSVAVLPFTNMSDDPKQEYFVDGMTEDLITDLSKVSGLFVIARNSSFTYKGKAVDVKQVGRELGVRYVLEGSVRRSGEQVRVNAQLIDATTGGHMWADRYDGRVEDIFSVQDAFVREIVKELAVNLSEDEQIEIGLGQTSNIEAREIFQKGLESYLNYSPDENAAAISQFEKAIGLDPEYGRAYAGLGLAYIRGCQLRWNEPLNMSTGEAFDKAISYLDKTKDHPSTLAHVASSRANLYDQQYAEAVTEATRALAKDPNDPEGYVAMAWAMITTGQPDAGVELMRRATRLNPNYPNYYALALGMAHFSMDDLDSAADTFAKALERDSRAVQLAFPLAASYALLGKREEARAALSLWKPNASKFELERLPNAYHFPYKWSQDHEILKRLRVGLHIAAMPLDITIASLADTLNDENAFSRWNAANTLGKFGLQAVEAVPALIEALADEAPSVREEAAMTLGMIGPAAETAVSALKALQEESEFANVAGEALRNIQRK